MYQSLKDAFCSCAKQKSILGLPFILTNRKSQLYCASIAYIPVLISGMQAGFPAFIIPQLRREMNMDVDQLSWLASLGYFSLILGPLMTMYFINKYGRKTNLRLILLLFVAGWTVILVSNNFANLIIGLTLCGIASGSAGIIASVYVSEISRARYRGSMISMVFLVSIIGTSSVYSLEYYLPWRQAVGFIILLSLFGILLLRTIPESKHWYLQCDQKDAAKCSAAWFEDTPVVMKEVDILYLFTKVGKIYSNETGGNNVGFTLSGIKNMRLKPFILATVVSILRCGTGKVLFVVYPVNLFTDMHTPFDSYALSIWYGFLNLLCCFANMLIFSVVDKFNRKYFFYCLSSIMIAALVTVLIIEMISDDIFKPLPGLRVFCMYIYLITETTGYFCITSIMIFEVIPITQRGVGLSLIFLLTNVICTMYIKLFPLFEKNLSFGTMCIFFLANVVLVVWVVQQHFPETRGRIYFGINSSVNDAVINGQFDAMMKEDWLRNENVQMYLTANNTINVDQLDPNLLKRMLHDWMEKIKDMLVMNGVQPELMIGTAEAAPSSSGAQKHNIWPVQEPTAKNNTFDYEKMTTQGQVWFDNMKTNLDEWSQNEFLTAGNEIFKQQQKWFKNVWLKNMPKPMTTPMFAEGHRNKRVERAVKARQQSVANKSKITGSSEKIV